MKVQRTVTIIFDRECNSVKIILENPNYSEDSMTIKIISYSSIQTFIYFDQPSYSPHEQHFN